MTDNRILRNQVKDHVHLNDGERKTLAKLGKRLEKQALEEVATIVKPATILAWSPIMCCSSSTWTAERSTSQG